ncbi:boophilin-H2-like [Dermacentor albipictus]|uniref:boophilin-H2-like n=1 Tax=Dermacentor albipictus TaxID=60249 RepID=UPI0038FCADD8
MKLYIFLALLGTALAATNFDKQCGQKADVGICGAKLPRWWFNKETGKCEVFYYGGCGGNENKYWTKKKCEKTCSPVKAATNFDKQCGQKADVGICGAKLPRWWFNKETGKCEVFYYGGCGGNENKYRTKKKCEKTCSPVKAAAASVCHKPPYPGPCSASLERFYYDPNTNSCRPFIYGGCKSNGNNFESPIDCWASCRSMKFGEPMPRVA